MATHSRADVASFEGRGETRLVFARYRQDPTAPLFYLVQGEAEQRRAYAAEHLECPMGECHDRTVSVVNRAPKRRDGFRHRHGAGGHANESIDHIQGKAMLLRWLTRLQDLGHLDPEVDLAAEVPIGRDRVADVIVTWPTGECVALEVQYSALGRDAGGIEARTRSYAEHGVQCVWLLGHRYPHFVLTGSNDVRLTDRHRDVLATGQPLFWINPERDQIATAFSILPSPVPGDDTTFRRRPTTEDETVEVLVGGLDSCRITPTGIVMPALDRIDASTREHLTVKCEHQANLAAAERRAEEARQRRLEERRGWREKEASQPGPPRRPRPHGRPLVIGGRYHCYVCRWPMPPELAPFGGHLGSCVEGDVMEDDPPVEGFAHDPQLTLFDVTD